MVIFDRCILVELGCVNVGFYNFMIKCMIIVIVVIIVNKFRDYYDYVEIIM